LTYGPDKTSSEVTLQVHHCQYISEDNVPRENLLHCNENGEMYYCVERRMYLQNLVQAIALTKILGVLLFTTVAVAYLLGMFTLMHAQSENKLSLTFLSHTRWYRKVLGLLLL
jgi:hypothetical protein